MRSGGNRGRHLYCCAARHTRSLVLLVGLFLLPSSLRAESVLNFPRLSFTRDLLTGVAISNPTDKDALLTLTAYGAQGQLVEGPDIRNPVELPVNRRAQRSLLTSELFGPGIDATTVGWFQATSSVEDLTGFFLFMNRSMTLFDGADLPPSARETVFNQIRVGPDYRTELDLVNSQNLLASVQLQLISPDFPPIVRVVEVAPKGVARLDVGDFFDVAETAANTYVSASSDVEIAGFELVHAVNGDSLSLNARSASEKLDRLYFPHMAVLGPWKSELVLVNYSSQPVIATFTAFRADGSIYDARHLESNPVTRSLEAGASLAEDVAEMFGFRGEETLDGWIQVECTSPALNGYISYGVPASGSLASVPASVDRMTRAIFSHIATTAGFFTGLSILNPGTLATDVRVLAMQPSGEVLGSFDMVLQPGHRISRLLSELIPEASDQAGGLIWLKSQLPVHMISLFGTANVLASVPPQPAPPDYLPDSEIPRLKLEPPLAIVSPKDTQAFRVDSEVGVVWKVNGKVGGDVTVGTITEGGVYTAPQTTPDPRVVTILAETDSQVAGASVDVLEKSRLLGSLQVVQSVAYLRSVERLYTAELTVLSGGLNSLLRSQNLEASSNWTGQSATSTTRSDIFEVGPGLVKLPVASFRDEKISKMVPFRASGGKEYALLLAQNSGRIIRLDPVTKQLREVFTGLNQPTALVRDTVTGNFLVAEKNSITTVASYFLESDSSSPAVRTDSMTLLKSEGMVGIAVDACTGNVYVSDEEAGKILEYVRSTGEISEQVSGLADPGQLLAVYRERVSCPQAFQLLVSEAGADQVSLVTPSDDRVVSWAEVSGSTDLILLPDDTPFATGEAILVTQEVVEADSIREPETPQFSVDVVEVPDLYSGEPENHEVESDDPDEDGESALQSNSGGGEGKDKSDKDDHGKKSSKGKSGKDDDGKKSSKGKSGKDDHGKKSSKGKSDKE